MEERLIKLVLACKKLREGSEYEEALLCGIPVNEVTKHGLTISGHDLEKIVAFKYENMIENIDGLTGSAQVALVKDNSSSLLFFEKLEIETIEYMYENDLLKLLRTNFSVSGIIPIELVKKCIAKREDLVFHPSFYVDNYISEFSISLYNDQGDKNNFININAYTLEDKIEVILFSYEEFFNIINPSGKLLARLLFMNSIISSFVERELGEKVDRRELLRIILRTPYPELTPMLKLSEEEFSYLYKNKRAFLYKYIEAGSNFVTEEFIGKNISDISEWPTVKHVSTNILIKIVKEKLYKNGLNAFIDLVVRDKWNTMTNSEFKFFFNMSFMAND